MPLCVVPAKGTLFYNTNANYHAGKNLQAVKVQRKQTE